MKLLIASDHGGFELKQWLQDQVKEIEWADMGPSSLEAVDYPDYAHKVCRKIDNDPEQKAVLICGSGQGMAITANKYKNIRAALCCDEEMAQLARKHNDANVLCMGARLIEKNKALRILKSFLESDFEGGRHLNRIKKITECL